MIFKYSRRRIFQTRRIPGIFVRRTRSSRSSNRYYKSILDVVFKFNGQSSFEVARFSSALNIGSPSVEFPSDRIPVRSTTVFSSDRKKFLRSNGISFQYDGIFLFRSDGKKIHVLFRFDGNSIWWQFDLTCRISSHERSSRTELIILNFLCDVITVCK